MPTSLHRVQVLLQPEDAAKMKTLAKMERRTHSAMCAELIVAAMKMPKFREIIEEAEEQGAAVPAQEDPRQGRPQTQFREEIVATNTKQEMNFTQAQLQAIAENLLKMTNEQSKEKESKR